MASSSTPDVQTAEQQAVRERPAPSASGEPLIDRVRRLLAVAQARVRSRAAALLGLALCGLVLEFALARWWLGAFSLAGHRGFPAPGQDPLIWLLGDGDPGMSHFLKLLVAAFVPYLFGLAIAQRAAGRLSVAVALTGAVAFGFTLLAAFPGGALDIFHNIMDGRLVWLYHLNPILVAPSAVQGDPLFPYLHYWWDTRTAYGPLWFLLTVPAYLAAGDSLMRNIVAYKALPFTFELVSLVFIVLIVRRIDPSHTAAAVVCFGWNPLVLWEVAGNGHNDIVMMCFALAAILLLLSRHWPFAFPVLACSVLVKYISLILLPVFVIWVLRRYGRAALVPLLSGLLGAALVALVIFLPFWAGPRSFAPLWDQQNNIVFSPAAALIGDWGEHVPNSAHVVAVKNGLKAAFVLLYAVVLLRMRANPSSLIRACVEVMFLLLVLMTWWFWAWYVVWGLALAALLPSSPHARLFVVFSATAMLLYVSSPWRLSLWNFSTSFPLAVGTTLIVFLPPVLYAIMHLLDFVAPARPEAIDGRVGEYGRGS
jgi:alpha-1,6-mannosyltransferase